MAKNKFQTNEDGTVTFRISEVGDRSRTTYEGLFKVKGSLSPFDELSAGKDMRQLLGEHGAGATDHEINIAYALAQLRHRIVESPSFWTERSRDGFGGADMDGNVILHVLTLAVDGEVEMGKKFRQEAKRRLKEMSEALDRHDEKGAEGADE
jgi:hypothetical protein